MKPWALDMPKERRRYTWKKFCCTKRTTKLREYKIWGLLSFVIHRLSKATRRRGPPLDTWSGLGFSIIIDEFPSQSIQQNLYKRTKLFRLKQAIIPQILFFLEISGCVNLISQKRYFFASWIWLFETDLYLFRRKDGFNKPWCRVYLK